MDKRVKEYEKLVDFEAEVFAVVDMDMFYAAVEIRDNPSLKEKPVAVGGMSMISTTNYVARKFGVRSAMPGFIAIKLCPDLVFVPLNSEKYRVASEKVMKVLAEYDPDLKSLSLDEAYLNITSLVEVRQMAENKLNKQELAEDIVEEMRKKVFEATGLTCSAGIGPTSLIAKIASEKKKPDGQFCVSFDRDSVISFVRELPIRKVPGIGKVTEKILKDGFGIETVEDIFQKRYEIEKLMTPATSDSLLRVSIGVSRSTFSFQTAEEGRKSMSTERTVRKVKDFVGMCKIVHSLAEELVQSLKQEQLVGYVLSLKIKQTDFIVRNKQVKCVDPVGDDAKVVFDLCVTLLKSLSPPDIRLIGLKISDFISSDNRKSRKRQRQTFITTACESSKIKCPNCKTELSGTSNVEKNSHLDICLQINNKAIPTSSVSSKSVSVGVEEVIDLT